VVPARKLGLDAEPHVLGFFALVHHCAHAHGIAGGASVHSSFGCALGVLDHAQRGFDDVAVER